MLRSTLNLGSGTRSQSWGFFLLFFFFKQNLNPQQHRRQTEELADEACPFQDGEFASTVIDFRDGELFPLSFSCVVILKTIKANFLVVRTVREKRNIAELFTSLIPFLPLGLQYP